MSTKTEARVFFSMLVLMATIFSALMVYEYRESEKAMAQLEETDKRLLAAIDANIKRPIFFNWNQ